MKVAMFRRWSWVMALLVMLFAGTAWAETAESFVKTRQGELTALLKQPDSPAVQKKVENVFDQMLDYDSLARESMGKHWDGLSEEQRKEFQSLLTELVRRAYRQNLRKTLDWAVSFKGQDSANDGTLVQTVARHKTDKRQEPITVDYLVHQVGGKWMVHDIVTEGSSLVRNYRSQFNRIMKKSGYGDLVAKMKKKIAEDG